MREIAEDDHLMIEGLLQTRIWRSLTVQCSTSHGIRCRDVCPLPCQRARNCLNFMLPVCFGLYAGLN